MLVRLSRKADKTQISQRGGCCCRCREALCGRRGPAGKLDCFPHLPQIPETCNASQLPAPPWCTSARTTHHSTAPAALPWCWCTTPPACRTCTTTKKLARLAPGPAYHSQLRFLRDSPHLLHHRSLAGGRRGSPKTKNHLVRGGTRELGWIMSRSKKGGG